MALNRHAKLERCLRAVFCVYTIPAMPTNTPRTVKNLPNNALRHIGSSLQARNKARFGASFRNARRAVHANVMKEGALVKARRSVESRLEQRLRYGLLESMRALLALSGNGQPNPRLWQRQGPLYIREMDLLPPQMKLQLVLRSEPLFLQTGFDGDVRVKNVKTGDIIAAVELMFNEDGPGVGGDMFASIQNLPLSRDRRIAKGVNAALEKALMSQAIRQSLQNTHRHVNLLVL